MRKRVLLFFLFLCLLTACSCGGGRSSNPDEPPVFSPLQVLTPKAQGLKTIEQGALLLDFSNEAQGYFIMINQSPSRQTSRFRLQSRSCVEAHQEQQSLLSARL